MHILKIKIEKQEISISITVIYKFHQHQENVYEAPPWYLSPNLQYNTS